MPAFAPPESPPAAEVLGGEFGVDPEGVEFVVLGAVCDGVPEVEVVDGKGPSTAAITITDDVSQQAVLLVPQQ
jgi:hypothetical protein